MQSNSLQIVFILFSIIYSIYITLSVLIVCNFEKDLCHWERQPENADSKYAWFRNTSEALESAGLQGPSGTVYTLGQ